MQLIGPVISIVVALVVLLAMAFAFGAIVYALMVVRKKATGSSAGWSNQLFDAINAGNIPAQESDVLARGWIGEATLLDRMDVKTTAKNRTMVYYLCDFVLEVRLPGQAPYRVPCRQEFIGSETYDLSQGSVVPVRVDPSNPQIVYIDRDARKRQKLQGKAADLAAHARRQAELLGRR